MVNAFPDGELMGRRKIIFGRLRQEIELILRRLCEYKGVELLEGKACVDHIHMCIAIPLEGCQYQRPYRARQATGYAGG